MSISTRLFVWMGVVLAAAGETRAPMLQDPTHSAEFGWAKKKVYETRVLDDMTAPSRWALAGRGELKFATGRERRSLRVDVTLPGQNALPVASAIRAVPGEDWSRYNRISFWLRTDAPGFPVLTLAILAIVVCVMFPTHAGLAAAALGNSRAPEACGLSSALEISFAAPLTPMKWAM